jgi:hypothetical protein
MKRWAARAFALSRSRALRQNGSPGARSQRARRKESANSRFFLLLLHNTEHSSRALSCSAVLSWQFCIGVLSWQSLLDGPVLTVLSWQFCPHCPGCLSCPGCPVLGPVLVVLFWQSCSGSPVLAVLFCLSRSACPVLVPVLSVQFWLFRSGCLVWLSWFVLNVFFCLSAPLCPARALLS